jgi:hypothetical protein
LIQLIACLLLKFLYICIHLLFPSPLGHFLHLLFENPLYNTRILFHVFILSYFLFNAQLWCHLYRWGQWGPWDKKEGEYVRDEEVRDHDEA